MAIMNKILLASAALVAFTNAVPLHGRNVVARDMVTETTWTTVDVDVTVWVDQNGQPYSTETGAPYAPAAAAATTTPSPPPPQATTTPAAVSSSSSSPAASSNAGGSFYQAPSPSTTPAPAAPAVTTTPTPAYQAQPAPTSSAAASPASGGSGGSSYSGGGSSSGTCQGQSNSCSGDITHYDGGLGACGDNVNTNSDMYIALPVAFMEAAGSSWPNPLCGKSVTIYNPETKNTVQAVVKDKCMGCTGRSIDLTDVLFNAIAPNCDGRCSGFDWWFN